MYESSTNYLWNKIWFNLHVQKKIMSLQLEIMKCNMILDMYMKIFYTYGSWKEQSHLWKYEVIFRETFLKLPQNEK